jgi:hypothetical protein
MSDDCQKAEVFKNGVTHLGKGKCSKKINMENKLKTFVLIISRVFPAYHSRAGEETNFVQLIKTGKKIHTIQVNYELWEKRIREVQAGDAILSLRIWTGLPRKSKQDEIMRLDNSSEIEIEKICRGNYIYLVGSSKDGLSTFPILVPIIANNDGLNPNDFQQWFQSIAVDEPLAIIHFTSFRYCSKS